MNLSQLTLKRITIKRIVDEADNIKTFYFQSESPIQSQPGNFIMLWIPRVNAKPFSVYIDNGNEFACTIANVGEFTSALFQMKEGDTLGYYGPFGKPFELKGKHIALVGGGYGTAPLTFLAKEALKKGIKSELIIGARNKDLLLYVYEGYPPGISRHYCTDDGSYGFQGFTTQKLKEVLQQNPDIDMVYTVGPEIMMKKVIELCDEHNIDCQISLERYMKCGFGICGSCCVDPIGFRMCKEGPCVDKATAKKVTEFGKYHRDGAGKKIFY